MGIGIFTAINNSTGTATVTNFNFTNTSGISHVADLSNFGGASSATDLAVIVSSSMPAGTSKTFGIYYNTGTAVNGTYIGSIEVLTTMADTSIDTENLTNYIYIGIPGAEGPVDPTTPVTIDYGGGGDAGGGGTGCDAGAAGGSGSCGAGGGDGGGGGDCFIAEAEVLMADGTKKPIIDVKIGELVWNKDRTSVNQVKFIEKVMDSRWEQLYSPQLDMQPFATVNHPIYIDGKLSSVDPDACFNLYPWLGKTEKITDALVISAKGEYVYNLWVDGDGTYVVNGFGTTSIMGSGDFLRRSAEQGFLTASEVVEIMEFFTTRGKHVQYGGYLVNKILGAINNSMVDKLFSWGLKQDTWLRIFVKIFAKVLGYIMHPNR